MGETEESFILENLISFKGLHCSFKLITEEITKFEPSSSDLKVNYYSRCKKLEIQIEEHQSTRYKLTEIANPDKQKELVKLISILANKFINATRYYGLATHMHEIDISRHKPEYYLAIWNVESSIDEVIWNNVIPVESRLFSLFNQTTNSNLENSLVTSLWSDIANAIENERVPPPELEFTINALEHIELKNYRYAVLESVIGLEIVLTRFVNEYMSTRLKLPKEQIETFLNPSFGLSSRISGLLDLTIKSKDLKKIDMSKVKQVIKWRNHIVHKTGHLPEGIPHNILNDNLSSVLKLNFLLGSKTEVVKAAPETLIIGSTLV